MHLQIVYFIIILMCFCTENLIGQFNKSLFYKSEIIEFVINDTISEVGNLEVVMDTDSVPLYYQQKIFTGVCHTYICKPAQLSLFWDASGSFLGFLIPKDAPLTKEDHIEFTPNDYYLLYTILNNPFSVLGKLKYEDLTVENKSSKNQVDAVTSATIIPDKNTIVPQAIFTCYTLWNLTYNKNIYSEIQKYSSKYAGNFSNEDLKQLKVLLENPGAIHPGKLALLLSIADEEKKLKKYALQNLLTNNSELLSPFQLLIINNYINRQIFVYPEIETRLANIKKNQLIFRSMINGK